MPTLQHYDNVFPYLFPIGALAHSTSVAFNTENKDVDVETIFLDFSGTSPSPKKTMIKVDLADPVSGSILDQLQELELNSTICTMKLAKRGTTKQMKVDGFVRQVGGTSGVGEMAKISFEFHARPGKFE